MVVAYTYAGDSNLDGVVDTSDFMALAQNFGKHGSSTTWMTGDFNYDSVVNALDFNLVASNFGAPAAFTASAPPVLGSVVPEPATLGLLAVIAPLAIRRRRR